MNRLSFVILLAALITTTTTKAQFFSSMEAPHSTFGPTNALTKDGRYGIVYKATPVDTSGWFLRPLIGVGAGIASTGQLVTGAGISYENNSYTAAKGWYSNISFSWMLWAVGNAAPDGIHPTAGTGPAVALFNKLMLLGGMYNFGTHQIGAVVSIGIGFNNGAQTVTP